MSVVITLLCKFGHILLSIARALKKAICCRRRKETEYLLPMTVGHVIDMRQNKENELENSEFYSQWDPWPAVNSTSLNNGGVITDSESDSQQVQLDCTSQEDFFKDMVPQIRKPKQIFVSKEPAEIERSSSNRLAMDPKAIIMESGLGVIDDAPSNWEDNANTDELWDPDMLIRENRRAELEKRRADHQRRKLEKELKLCSKPESLSSIMLSLSDANDKHKYS